MRTLLALLALFIYASIAHADPLEIHLPTDPPEGGPTGLPEITSTWNGGPASLPYNAGTSSEGLISFGLGLTAVQPAIDAMLAKGYTRRSDLDAANTGVGQSTVILGFEKPGVSLWDEQPVIMIRSQAVNIDGTGWIPTTVVGSFVASDAVINEQHVPVINREPQNEPMLVYQHIDESAMATLEAMGDQYQAYYTMRELFNNPWNVVRSFTPSFSADAANWWYGLADNIGIGAVSGAITSGTVGAYTGGAAGLPPGIAIGLVTGAVSGAGTYIATHPYP